jgi:hypothetical protein
MIGGVDIRIATSADDSAAIIAVRVVLQYWPHAAFENAVTGEYYKTYWQIPFSDLKEIFVYRDASAAQQWDAEGAVPGVHNTMIHILRDKGLLTLVVDDPEGSEMGHIIADVSCGLKNDIMNTAAEVEAA